MALLALSPGQMAYAGYVFPRSFMLVSRAQANETESQSVPFAPGNVAWSKRGVGSFTVSGVLGGSGAVLDQNGAQMLTADAVQAEIDRLLATMVVAADGDQPFQWRPDRYVNARMGTPRISYAPGEGYRFAQVDIDFTASDPRSYSNAQHTLSVSSTGAAVWGGTPVPTHIGNSKSYPTITLTFAAATTNPGVYVAPANGAGTANHISFSLVGTFQATDTIVVTCDPRARSLTKNGVVTWSLLSLPTTNGLGDGEILPYIAPNSPWNMGVTCSSGNVTASAAWNDVWL